MTIYIFHHIDKNFTITFMTYVYFLTKKIVFHIKLRLLPTLEFLKSCLQMAKLSFIHIHNHKLSLLVFYTQKMPTSEKSSDADIANFKYSYQLHTQVTITIIISTHKTISRSNPQPLWHPHSPIFFCLLSHINYCYILPFFFFFFRLL